MTTELKSLIIHYRSYHISQITQRKDSFMDPEKKISIMAVHGNGSSLKVSALFNMLPYTKHVGAIIIESQIDVQNLIDAGKKCSQNLILLATDDINFLMEVKRITDEQQIVIVINNSDTYADNQFCISESSGLEEMINKIEKIVFGETVLV